MPNNTYHVAWPAVAVQLESGKEKVLQQGDKVPAGVTEEHASLLASFGALVLAPTAAASTATEAAPLSDGTRPADSAKKAVWVAYAVTQGMTEEDAKASTVSQLAERFPAEPETPPQDEQPPADGDGSSE